MAVHPHGSTHAHGSTHTYMGGRPFMTWPLAPDVDAGATACQRPPPARVAATAVVDAPTPVRAAAAVVVDDGAPSEFRGEEALSTAAAAAAFK